MSVAFGLTKAGSFALTFGLLSLGLSACGDGKSSSEDPPETTDEGTDTDDPTDGIFESVNPGSIGFDDDEAVDDDTDAPSGDEGEAPSDQEDSDDVARDITEADIIQVEGDRLYALSNYGGLSVIDIDDTSDMRLLGRFKVTASPFEMYVRDGVALVLYNGYGEYTYDETEDLWTWYQTSYVVAVDTTGQEPREVGRFHVPGYISDSRIVGDNLYVVAFEDGYCWECDEGPRTHLISLDVSDASDVELVDELSFTERDNGYSWRRSVESTTERLFIAGPTWGDGDEPAGSTITVVDISDPAGDMVQGASVEVTGQIESRWQMNEHDGVLRVVSQPFAWWGELTPPRIETFSVVSSAEVEPLGAIDMQIPERETLRSVRFDGDRAYAITAEQMDPLFTLDLSDPENPRQVGELEMPGWVYHLEPRGERVLGLGYDQVNDAGSLTVSLFDVSDFENPTMLTRVNFGGDWGSLAEDQDRIHKAFRVLDDAGLLLVPFSGWSYDQGEEECGASDYFSGVQLIDWQDDGLALRGVASAYGSARRGFIVGEHLLTMSDDRVESYDIGDRDNPVPLDAVTLALQANQVATAGDVVARVGNDWHSNTTEITISSLADVNNPDRGRMIEIPDLGRESCYGGSWLSEIVASDDEVYALYEQYDYDAATGKDEQSTRIVTIDVSEPETAEIIAEAELEFRPSYGYGYSYAIVNNGRSLLQRGKLLIFAQIERDWDDREELRENETTVKLVDMSDPASPAVSSVILPQSEGATALLLDGDVIATSHFTQSPSNPDRLRFYLDRIDISDPGEPRLLEPVNIPGSLLAYDAEQKRAFTLSYSFDSEASTQRECQEELGGSFDPPEGADDWDWETTVGECRILIHTLHLVVLDDGTARIVDSHRFERGQRVGGTALGDDRLFVSLGGYHYSYGDDVAVDEDVAVGGYYGYSRFASGEAPLLVFSGLSSGELELGSIELETGDGYYGSFSRLVATGRRAVVSTGFLGKLVVVDAADTTEPKLVREVELAGYVSDLALTGDVAIAAMGYDGVQTVQVAD